VLRHVGRFQVGVAHQPCLKPSIDTELADPVEAQPLVAKSRVDAPLGELVDDPLERQIHVDAQVRADADCQFAAVPQARVDANVSGRYTRIANAG
jgi:hypothetical protein